MELILRNSKSSTYIRGCDWAPCISINANNSAERGLHLLQYNTLYNIDRSVLLENTLCVKLIRNFIRNPSGVFSISSLVRILMTSFPALSQSFVQTVGEKWRAIDLSI